MEADGDFAFQVAAGGVGCQAEALKFSCPWAYNSIVSWALFGGVGRIVGYRSAGWQRDESPRPA